MDTRGEDTQSDLLHKETIRHLESLLGREREREGEREREREQGNTSSTLLHSDDVRWGSGDVITLERVSLYCCFIDQGVHHHGMYSSSGECVNRCGVQLFVDKVPTKR